MKGINSEDVAQRYNSLKSIWNKEDKWHYRTHNNIKDFIYSSITRIPNLRGVRILNAGSGGYSYGLDEAYIIHIDIANRKIAELPNAITGSIENIPLNENSVGGIICVGSVLNYCDPVKVMSEFQRVLIPGGYIIIEFENSYTFELAGKHQFNKKVALVETFYNGHKEKLWYFSESFIEELAGLNDFTKISSKRWHILSPLIYRLFKSEKYAAKFASMDNICSAIPILRNFSSNTIFLLRKNIPANLPFQHS